MDRRLANLERISPPTHNSLPPHEWIARTEQEGWGDVISVRFSNGQRIRYARGRGGFLEKLAELKRAGSIDDEAGVEFTITHTFVDPPKRDE
jgi:cystathionine beta-lyase/cystathionine gamma-synthase